MFWGSLWDFIKKIAREVWSTSEAICTKSLDLINKFLDIIKSPPVKTKERLALLVIIFLFLYNIFCRIAGLPPSPYWFFTIAAVFIFVCATFLVVYQIHTHQKKTRVN